MDAVKISKALADPLRWEILKKIASGIQSCCTDSPGVCVCHVVDDMNLLQSKVSYHIKELKEAELIREETRGRWNFYYIRQETLRAYMDTLNKEFKL
jgi:ArsR family transcriptional regulator, arsenate/arsenite/antimonite-responsive transcriptional repressor